MSAFTRRQAAGELSLRDFSAIMSRLSLPTLATLRIGDAARILAGASSERATSIAIAFRYENGPVYDALQGVQQVRRLENVARVPAARAYV